jgi:hypothetical protein
MVRRFLEVVREREQRGLGEPSTIELDTNGKAARCEAGGHRDRGQSCVGGKRSIAAGLSTADDGCGSTYGRVKSTRRFSGPTGYEEIAIPLFKST